MRGARVGVGVLVLGLLAASVGWYLAAHPRGDAEFSSCAIEDGSTLVLGYQYGSGDELEVTFRPSREAYVVKLRRRSPEGPQPAILFVGEARFLVSGPVDLPVTYSDGTRLDCQATRSAPAG